MKRVIKTSLTAGLLICSTVMMADEVAIANSIDGMFKNGNVSGQIRLGYINNNAAQSSVEDSYATAIGGQLKFETASLNGLSLGAAFYTSHAIRGLSGSDGKFDETFTSSEKSYTELAETYINYTRNGFNLRIGRQLIDTPLADSDDIALTPHTFEAAVASYSFSDMGLTLIGANVQSWQGIDSDYANVIDNSWAETNGAGGDGTWMAAALYSKDNIDAGAWYYDVDKAAKAAYIDATINIELGSGAALAISGQYLNESESNTDTGVSSGIDGSIAGAMIEASHSGLSVALAYDRVSVNDGDQIFEGFGGGSSYTNMDTMTAATFNDGTYGDGSSYLVSASYDISGINLFAAYGDFKADAIGAGAKAHVTELDIGATYEYNDGEADLFVIYVDQTDKESAVKTAYDNSYFLATVNYNF